MATTATEHSAVLCAAAVEEEIFGGVQHPHPRSPLLEEAAKKFLRSLSGHTFVGLQVACRDELRQSALE